MIKIMVTLGSESIKERNLKKLSKKTKIFRFNGSHGDLNWHKNSINFVRKSILDPLIVMDIPGIKPRTNNTEKILIKKDEIIHFGNKKTSIKNRYINLSNPLPTVCKKQKLFSVADGNYSFKLLKFNSNELTGKSLSDFTLLPKKGFNIPLSKYDEDLQEKIYLNFINKIKDFNIDGLGLSFIQSSNVIKKIKKKYPNFFLISKIENYEGFLNRDEIIKYSDAIMIDRGDLCAEIGIDKLFESVEEISIVTKSFGKPLIMATENLETMLYKDNPSKSEIMSLGHAKKLGTDCIMLSDETANTEKNVKITNWLYKFLKNLNKGISLTNLRNKHKEIFSYENQNFTQKTPVLIASSIGETLNRLVSQQKTNNIILITNNKKLINISKLFSLKIKILKTNIKNIQSETNLLKIIKRNSSDIFKNKKKIMAFSLTTKNKEKNSNFVILKKTNFIK